MIVKWDDVKEDLNRQAQEIEALKTERDRLLAITEDKNIHEMFGKAKAWDELSLLVDHSYAAIFDIVISKSIFHVNGERISRFSKEAITNALSDVKGELS